jgi:hypothetical protein
MAASSALMHDLLCGLLGHTGQCIRSVLRPVPSSSPADGRVDGDEAEAEEEQLEVVGLALTSEVPLVTPAERAAIDNLLVAAFAYVRIMHFVQNIDGGATIDTTTQTRTAAANHLANAALVTKIATNPAEQRALQAQQARHGYAAAGALLSPTKPARPTTNGRPGADVASSNALVPLPELPAPTAPPAPKVVGLYLRALGLGLEEVLSGYRSLVLRIEQEILAEIASNPSSAPGYTDAEGRPTASHDEDDERAEGAPPPPRVHRIEFGLAKLTLRLRQYLIILPALQNLIATIVSGEGEPVPTTQNAATNTSSSANGSTSTADAPSAAASVGFRTHSVHGLRLLSLVASHASTGVPVLRLVFQQLLRRLDAVLLNQLVAWMVHGEVRDPYKEFFIAPAAADGNGAADKPSGVGSAFSAPAPALDWDRSFVLEPSQLPLAYLDELGGMATAHRVLFTGKGVRVLQRAEARSEEQRRRKEKCDARNKARRQRDRLHRGDPSLSSYAFSQSGTPFAAAAAASSSSHMRTGSLSGARTPYSRGSTANTPRDTAAGAFSFRFASTGGAGAAPTAAAVPPPVALLHEASKPFLVQFYALVPSDISSAVASSSSEPAPSLHSSLPQLEALVARWSDLVSERLYSLLLTEDRSHGGGGGSDGGGHLLSHLRHLKSFFLLGAGDYATHFVERITPVLERVGASGGGASASGPAHMRLERELNGPAGPLKTALAYGGLQLDAPGEDDEEEDEADEEDFLFEQEDIHSVAGVAAATMAVSARSQRRVANYPVHHLSVHLDPAVPPVPSSSATHPLPSPPTTASAASTTASLANPWNRLRLDYHVRAPLDLLLSAETLSRYNAIWRFLLQVRRANLAVERSWHPLLSRARSNYSPGVHGTVATHMPVAALRHGMSFVLTTLLNFLHCDVVESAWNALLSSLATGPRSFKAVRGAHEEYLSRVSTHCFLRDRLLQSALHDVFDTCLLFARSCAGSPSGAPSPSATASITRDFQRQASFLFALLQRKATFTGGRAGTLHALVSRLDYNGGLTRLTAGLGGSATASSATGGSAAGASAGRVALSVTLEQERARKTATALVPASHARGTVLSATDIAASLRRGR